MQPGEPGAMPSVGAQPYAETMYKAYRMGARAGACAYHTAEGVIRVADRTVKVTDRNIRKNHVQQLTTEQVETIRALYDEGDVHKDGTLDKIELRVALHKLTGKWLPAHEMNEVWMEIDRDGNGTISFDEFLLHVGPFVYPPKTYTVLRAASERAAQVKQVASKRLGESAALATDASLDLTWPWLEQAVNTGVVDGDMPEVIQEATTKIVASVMRDLKIEVKELALQSIRSIPRPEQPDKYKNIIMKGLRRARGWFLYTLFPYDRTIWVQLRDPWFYVLKGLSFVPAYGIQPIFFIIQFLLMEHWDEFQLVHYILLFKGSQFFSIGLVQLVVGAALYYAWGGSTSFFPWPRADDYRTYLFASQIGVVWCAFLLLPYSKEKGRVHKINERTQVDDSMPIGRCCGLDVYEARGGRLRVFLLYDLGVFMFCLALTLAVAFGTSAGPINSLPWRQRMDETVYWTKTLYGLLSWPFMFFMIPVIGSLFTHTLPSGYTKYGRCVPVLDSHLMARKAEERRVEKELQMSKKYLKRVGGPVPIASLPGQQMPEALDFEKQLQKEKDAKEQRAIREQNHKEKRAREEQRKRDKRARLAATRQKAGAVVADGKEAIGHAATVVRRASAEPAGASPAGARNGKQPASISDASAKV